jgi:hypothetical protein
MLANIFDKPGERAPKRSLQMTDYHAHYNHSRLVARWGAKEAICWIDDEVRSWTMKETRTLRSPHSGYLVEVRFAGFTEKPEFVRVRSTNWRAEDEPNGIFHRADACAFYRELLAAGFRKVES